MKKIKKLLKKHEVISFDIFDTLLTRPYINPYDLLKHVERTVNIEGFAENRYLAEGIARKKSQKEDITFDEIYENVEMKYQQIKSTELLFEETLLKANREVYQIYELAKKLNKRIIIISDMYLSKNFLEKVLIKNGYNGWEKFYLSNEYGVAKYSGNLFKEVLKDLKINPNKILHIGDSLISDFKQPRKLGIHAYRIPSISEKFFKAKENKIFQKCYKKYSKSLEISLILSLLADKFNQVKEEFKFQNYWNKWGYSFGGPIGYGFANFILSQAIKNNCQDLCFIARDGYTLQKIVNILKGDDIKTFYVHAQRILRARMLLDYGDQHNADLLLKVLDEKLNRKQKLETFDEKKSYIEKNIYKLEIEANKKQKQYAEYLSSLGIQAKNKISIIDTGAATFSAQQILEKVLNKKIIGIYTIITRPDYAKEKNISYCTWVDNMDDIKSVTSLIEFCFSSPEKPVIDITKSGPIYYKDVHKRELYRINLYPEISDGIVDFANDLHNRLCGLDISFSPVEVNKYINILTCNLSIIDKIMFKKIHCSTNASHTEFKETLLKKVCTANQKRKIITILGVKLKFKVQSLSS